jgi:hypothetical protein
MSGTNDVLFDVLSAHAGRGVQAEGDELANTAVPLMQGYRRLCKDACLFTCVQVCGLLRPENDDQQRESCSKR